MPVVSPFPVLAALMLAVSTANISLGRWEMTIASCASPRT